MTTQEFWQARVEDMTRHLADLEHNYYDGAESRPDREQVFHAAFDLLTPLALQVLADMNAWFCAGHATAATDTPHDDGAGGLVGGWTLSWPRLEQSRNVHNGEPLRPVTIDAVYPINWTHGHLARLHAGLPAEVTAWPMQVQTPEDAARQEPVLRLIAEAELHERLYQAGGDWQLCRPL